MKRIISIGLYLISCVCLVAQTTKTYTISSDKNDFSFNQYEGSTIVTTSVCNLNFEKDTSLPAIPYKVINILMPENQKLKRFSYSIKRSESIADITLASNPTYRTTRPNVDTTSTIQQRYPLEEYPFNIELLNEQTLECYRYARFKVSLFAYNANSKTITWPSEVELSIETEHIASEATNIIRPDVVTNILEKILLNPEEIYEPAISYSTFAATPEDSESINYLIITSESLKSSFLPLATWKTIKGRKAKIVTVEEIYEEYAAVEGSNQLKIKQCIYDYYAKGLNYVLLGGDETIVPAQGCYGTTDADGEISTDSNIPTDLFYANLTGRLDWNADGDNFIGEEGDNNSFIPNIAIGRFPVSTSAQAGLLVQKTINYEQNPPKNNWANRMLLAGASWDTETENARYRSDRMFSTYIQPYWDTVEKTRFYDTETDFESGSDYNLNSANLQEQINSGYHHIHMDCHGLPTVWWLENGTFSCSDAASLANSVPTVIATTACETNAFDQNTPCLSEALLRSTNSGIMAYLGSSRYGIDGAYLPGPSSEHNGLFYKNIFNGADTGTALRDAKIQLIQNNLEDENYRWVSFALNFMGDPELCIYTDNPQKVSDITWGEAGGSGIWIRSENHEFRATITSKSDNGESYFATYTTGETNSTSQEAYLLTPDNWDTYQLCICIKNHVPVTISDLSSMYIQNQTFSGTNNITGENIYIGSNINPVATEGPVTIESGNTTFDATNSVTIKNGFECQKGAILEIK